MDQLNRRRASDEDIIKLIERVAELDKDVIKLRDDFDTHVKIEDEKYFIMQTSLNLIQSKVDQLLIEIKEPLEAYKKAKYGFGGVKWIADTAKWAAPLILGILLGYGFINPPVTHSTPAPTHIEQPK